MHIVRLLIAAALFAHAPAFGQGATEQASPRNIDIATHVAEASQRFGIPESWIYAVMRVESAGRIGAVSSAGAMGLMQLMPGTWARQRSRFVLSGDPFDPRDNIMAGTSYLREMYDSYGAKGFLAAYNAGPSRYEQHRDRGRPLPAETRAYVALISPMLHLANATTMVESAVRPQPVRTSWTHSQLFAARSDHDDRASSDVAPDSPSQSALRSNAPSNGLFVAMSSDRPQ
jgi:hypothetical protein